MTVDLTTLIYTAESSQALARCCDVASLRANGSEVAAGVERGRFFVTLAMTTLIRIADASEAPARRCDAAPLRASGSESVAGVVRGGGSMSSDLAALMAPNTQAASSDAPSTANALADVLNSGADLSALTRWHWPEFFPKYDARRRFDPFVAVVVGQAKRLGPTISDDSFLAAAAAIGLGDGATNADAAAGSADDFASLDGRDTPDPYARAAMFAQAILAGLLRA